MYCACIADLPRVTELLLNFDSRWPEVPVDREQFSLGVKPVAVFSPGGIHLQIISISFFALDTHSS